MPKSIIVEGKTTSEAISNGLKELNVSKDKVNIKIIEEHEKRSFFSILSPRIVKVELTLKEEETNQLKIKKNNTILPDEEALNSAKLKIDNFMNDFIKEFTNLEYKTEIDLKLDKINSDTQHGFERIDLKFDNFEKRIENLLLSQENKRIEEQAKNRREFIYWFVGLFISSIIGIAAIIVTILTTK